ncbi:hypothetical protein ACFFLS_09945 [Flavobacterium procerum]|uniref:Uncharacterized protein n=1 Tax=Flavobacterium procerum TaxID=1455569 RepID=A0ABV6BPH6_9FLAO
MKIGAVFLQPEKNNAMNKNTIHNFNISVENSADIQSSEQLTQNMIKELAKVSREINQQKDIVQLWQEQNQNNTVLKKHQTPAEEGAIDTHSATKADTSFNTTSSVSGISLSLSESNYNASIGGGAADTTQGTTMSSFTSISNTLPVSKADDILNDSISIYNGMDGKQSLTIPTTLQNNEPSVEVVKAEIQKKLNEAKKENNPEATEYWTRISKAFEEGMVASDFNGKPNEMLFTQMYTALKQSKSLVEIRNFNWENVRKEMIKAIDANILKEKISGDSKKRWTTIKMQLSNENADIANLFANDELFALLREVLGLEDLPNTITITTKTKIYPNLSPGRLYARIGKKDVYASLRKIDKIDEKGRAVNSGAVKIKNTNAVSFMTGESLEFFLDETLITESLSEKENINWVIYKDSKKLGVDFVDKGTSFAYNFTSPGTYIVEAYGSSSGAITKTRVIKSAFVKFKVIAQEIVIMPPASSEGEFIRPFAEEKLFLVSLKNTTLKPLNPIKLYYQIETTLNGKKSISEEKELDSIGIIKLAMPDLGTYKIKVSSKDQYRLSKEFKTSVIKNEVTSIAPTGQKSGNVFLLGSLNSTLTLQAKTFEMDPTDVEKRAVKWIVYDAKNKPYLTPGTALFTNTRDSKKSFVHKGNSFTIVIPQDEGNYTVEAFSERQKGVKSKSVYRFEVKHPQITEAHWAWSTGNQKTTSGLLGEGNWIKTSIPHYNNQKVRIYFYLNNKKTSHYIDVYTNKNGEISKEIRFDSDFQKRIGFQGQNNAKIGFKLLGIQNGTPYKFKSPADYDANTVLSVTTKKEVIDVFFRYDGKRVSSEDEVPFNKKGSVVTIVAKTQNMIGDEITLKAHKVNDKPLFISKVKVNSEGIAATTFLLRNFDEKLKIGTKISYNVVVLEYPTRHLKNKGMVLIVGEGEKKETMDENTLGLIWGAKVSVAFRQKVVSICKDMWGEEKKYEMANALMIAMSVETGESFSSSLIRSTKEGKYYGVSKEEHKNNPNLVHNQPIGLAQFTPDAVKSLILNEKGISENKQTADAITIREVDDYKQKLALLSPEEQLSYVKTYLMLFNNHKKVKRPEDVYMIIFAPRAAGKEDDEEIYKKYLTEEDKIYNRENIKYTKNASMDIINNGFNRGNNDSIIQYRELLSRYREMKAKGLRYTIDINEARKLNQVLAEKILKGGRVTFANAHSSGVIDQAMAIDNITDTSIGKNAKQSNYGTALGGEVEVLSELLYIMYQLSKDYTFKVSEISGADHSRNSSHYFGKAFDVSEINGLDIGQGSGEEAVANPKVTDQLINEFRAKALSYGALLVWNRITDTDDVKKQHHNHFHVEVK